MKKILIIEDEHDTLKVLAKRLSTHGYKVVGAVDAYQGVELARKEEPDAIILDLMLPAGGGMSVLKNLRKSGKTITIPVIVLTGIKDEEYKQEILDEGVEAYIEKPYDFEELLKTIEATLKSGENG